MNALSIKLLILFFLRFVLPEYPAIHDCQVTSVPDTRFVSLLCRLRTINSDIDETNFGVIPPSNTIEVKIECSDVLFFQSALQNKSFSHLNNLLSLDIRYCKIAEIPQEAFTGLHSLRNLTLKTYNTDWSAMSLKINSNAFSDQDDLERLDLSDNNIWNLPPRLFCRLDNLTVLNFSNNKLQNVIDLSFSHNVGKCAPRLRFLDLSKNFFLHLPPSSFEALKNLTFLNVSTNGIREIADQAFFGMYSLQVLDLSGNQLITMPPDLFKENQRLSKLYVQNNSISVLAPGLFSHLNMLLELNFSTNDLTNTWVNSETFMDLISLAILDISFNKISRIDAATFRYLTNLQILHLEYNEIEYISQNSFRGLFRLHTLNLSNNRIKEIDKYTLSGLVSLLELSLKNNIIYSIHPDVFHNSTAIQKINLSNNSLTEFPSAISSLSSVKNIDLSFNQINNVTEDNFNLLSDLVALFLNNNKIATILKTTFFSLERLQVLNLSHNIIKSIKNGAFDKNQRMTAIRIDNNLLSNIHGLFSNLFTLRWLNVSNNNLEMFDFAFIPKELEYLDLKHNKLNELGNHFEIESQLHLKVLDASHNNIRDISANSVPDSIEVIFLNNNLIHTVHAYTFFKKDRLNRVDLFSNRIKKIEQNAIRLNDLPKGSLIPEIYLAENPFDCDCELQWMQTVNIQQYPQQTPRVVDLTSIMCTLISRRGPIFTPLLETEKYQFLCQYESHCLPVCHCCDFDACDCEMICPYNCTCFHDKTWTANIIDCSNAGLHNVPEKIPMHASEANLDGNFLGSLSSHTFIGRKNLRVLYLNNSRINVIHNRTFNGLRKLKIIYLNNNNLTSLRGFEFQRLKLLKELHLQNNYISSIHNSTFINLISLEILRLDGNLLVSYNFARFSENPLLRKLWLGLNPWTCACKFIEHSTEWLIDTYKIVVDRKELYCSPLNKKNNISFGEIIYNGTCTPKNFTVSYKHVSTKDYLFFPTISLGASAIFLAFVLLLFCNKNKLKIWLFSKYGMRLCQRKEVNTPGKYFDSFVSYSSKDEVFVTQILAPELERGSRSYKLCLHYRDFPIGSYVSDTILGAVESSKRTIVVLSENFIKSEWSRYDFRSAHHEVFRNRKQKLIVILLGEVPQSDLDSDLKLFLKTNTYLKWGDNRFWEKLKFAMPDVQPNNRANAMSSLNQDQGSITSNHSSQCQVQQSQTQLQQLHHHQLHPPAHLYPLHHHHYHCPSNHSTCTS